MTKTSTVAEWALPWGDPSATSREQQPALVVAWCLSEPARCGEAARIARPLLLGRMDDGADEVAFFRERPSGRTGGGRIGDARISRRQLAIEPEDAGRLRVENVGKCPLFVNGERTTSAVVGPGDTLALQNVLVLLVVERPELAPMRSYPARLAFPFGAADAHGIVGESAAAWQLREELATAASSGNHVLLRGQSGSGKELAARAVHALSSRSGGPFVARNAATFPEGLIDAELFGNVKNYPHSGMPERRGLVGEAHGGTLFLDEIGELSPALQAHLLRVLDRGGEYQRLGEGRTSSADLRIVAATNRAESDLKHDFLARFTSRVRVPSLIERREDVPLLVRHLAGAAARRDPGLTRFFTDASDAASLRIEPGLVEALVRHDYTHDVRELERLVVLALSTSPGNFVAMTEPVREALAAESPAGGAPPSPEEPDVAVELSREQVEAALARAGGSVTRAARDLGVRSRYSLYRTMKKLGITG
jgi:two-component system nitrogen regulation response regulator GlnG/two-component system response regulator HydG